jgi:uncharacterized protein (DUF362 family)/NAD-dependent dihydropyrimidine dehydrogenase PreA subunit
VVRGTSTVVLAACQDYDRDRVLAAVRTGLGHFDLTRIAFDAAATGKPLLLKPNLLMATAAEKGVTTHPAVFSAVARVMQEHGAHLVFGDSPNLSSRPLTAARRCGLLEEAEALGIPLADFESGADVSYPQGVQDRRFTVARGVLDAGAVINLPRLKTHMFTVMTGALKNTFGVIPGGIKAELHISHSNMEDFSRMIVDLNGLVPSRLVVLDAIRAMQGNGPGSGDLVDVGVLIISDDPVAADAVGCRIMGIDPLSVPMVRIAHESGLGNAHPESIDLRGEGITHYIQRSFKMPPRSPSLRMPPMALRIARKLVLPRPVIDPLLCTKCGECVTACPMTPKTIAITPGENGGIPHYDYAACIRCYCCQETCRSGAISVKTALLGARTRRT